MPGILNRNHAPIYFVAAVLSVLLSIWVGARETVLNPDAICYLQSAAGVSHGIKTAMRVCGQAMWPFYSILIYAVSRATFFSLTFSAYLLNGFFSLLSVLAFISITRFFTDKKSVLWFSAAVILLSHEFDAVRYYIIRDHGFWAFYLLSIVFSLYYFKNRSITYAFFWSLSLVVATLFRIEGAVFLLALPFVTFFETKQTLARRIKAFLQLNTVTFAIIVFLLTWIFLHPTLREIGRLGELRFQLEHGFAALIQNFNLKAGALGSVVLGPDSAHDAKWILLIMLAGWYLVSIVSNLSLVYSVLVIYAWIKKSLKINLVLAGYLFVNVLITSAFLVEHFFFSKRYLIALSLVLMIFVPFALETLREEYRTKKWPLVLALFFMVISSLGGIFDFGYSKRYIYDAGHWLALNTPSDARIYSNNIQVMYYSGRFGDSVFAKEAEFADVTKIAHSAWKQYDYLALLMNSKNSSQVKPLLEEIGAQPIEVFMNKRGDQIRIYRRLKA